MLQMVYHKDEVAVTIAKDLVLHLLSDTSFRVPASRQGWVTVLLGLTLGFGFPDDETL